MGSSAIPLILQRAVKQNYPSHPRNPRLTFVVLKRTFAKTLASLAPSGSLVAAISGGLDSMTLLDLLAGVKKHKIIVVHFNHLLRAEESDGDEQFVRDEARRRKLEFESGRADVRSTARQQGISIEMAARQHRHAFLAQVAKAHNADIVLAHHADDQIETFLLRLLRGIEGPGLAGMRLIAPSPADPNIRLLRPLLETTRDDLHAFAKKKCVRFRLDSSNALLNVQRNRLRLQVIPALRAESGPQFHDRLHRHIQDLRHAADSNREAARAWLQAPSNFGAMPDWLRREVIAAQLDDAKIPVTAARLKTLLAKPGAFHSISSGHSIAIDSQGKLQQLGQLWPKDSLKVDLSQASSAGFADVKLTWRRVATANLKPTPNQMTFDAERIGSKIVLRHWQQGDRIQLLGRNSSRPLHEMLSRNKIPRAQRHRLLVAVTAQGEIFWVEGLRITEQFKVTSSTKTFLEWRWQRRVL